MIGISLSPQINLVVALLLPLGLEKMDTNSVSFSLSPNETALLIAFS